LSVYINILSFVSSDVVGRITAASKQKGPFGFDEGRGNSPTLLILRSFSGLVKLVQEV